MEKENDIYEMLEELKNDDSWEPDAEVRKNVVNALPTFLWLV